MVLRQKLSHVPSVRESVLSIRKMCVSLYYKDIPDLKAPRIPRIDFSQSSFSSVGDGSFTRGGTCFLVQFSDPYPLDGMVLDGVQCFRELSHRGQTKSRTSPARCSHGHALQGN